MNKLFRTGFLLLLVGLTACASTQSNTELAANDEDKDIGLGGTGLLVNNDGGAGSGLGGTGILGTITGFGSIFVNGIEIEYDNTTAFTIDGQSAKPQALQIGDVVEVLTTNDNKHTQARIINLRHELIGKVESVEPETFSFTVSGQSVVQAINKVAMPEVGATVAVSGFRINEKTILATRVSPAATKQNLLRTVTDLPFKGKANRWLVQTHVQNNKAIFELDGTAQTIKLKQKTSKTFSDQLGIKILKLQKPTSGQLQLDSVIEPMALPRGRWQAPANIKQPGHGVMPRTTPGSVPGSMPGTTPGSSPGSGQGAMPSATEGAQSGSMQNMKR